MARWKARVEFLLTVIELLFLPLTVEALEGKMCQNSLPSGGVGQFQPRFHGEGVIPLQGGSFRRQSLSGGSEVSRV